MSSVSTEAAAKLNNSSWRWKASWWIWVPIVSCGLASFVGFVVAGVRFQERRYWVAAVVSSVGVALTFALIAIDNDRDTVLADLGAAATLITMVGSAIAAGIWNRGYLIRLAERSVRGRSPYVTPSAAPTPPPTSGGYLGVDPSAFYNSPPPVTHEPPPSPPLTSGSHQGTPLHGERPLTPRTLIDVNTATTEELVSGLAIDPDLAVRVVRARAQKGRYESLDQLAFVADLQPHELVRFRNRVSFGGRQPPPSGTSGRVLDF